MDRIEAQTVVYRPTEDVFAFLLDFTGYAGHSKYLTDVTQHGSGGIGTEYALRFEWWRLAYTLRSAVRAVEAPRRIDWEVVRDVDARGRWLAEPMEPPAAAPTSLDEATAVTLRIEYDPSSGDPSTLNIPRFVSTGWVIDRVISLVREEAERVVSSVVADLEGESRPVDLSITHESAVRPTVGE